MSASRRKLGQRHLALDKGAVGREQAGIVLHDLGETRREEERKYNRCDERDDTDGDAGLVCTCVSVGSAPERKVARRLYPCSACGCQPYAVPNNERARRGKRQLSVSGGEERCVFSCSCGLGREAIDSGGDLLQGLKAFNSHCTETSPDNWTGRNSEDREVKRGT